jgi:hypothetical protein
MVRRVRGIVTYDVVKEKCFCSKEKANGLKVEKQL